MRLLALLNAFEPDRGGGAAVYSDMCFALAEQGIEVTVLAPYPFYPEWKDKSGRNGFRTWKYTERGVRVQRFGMYIPSNPRSVFQRGLFECSLTLSLMRAIPEARRHDVIMAYCPQVSNIVVATIMRALYRKPVWLNVQDVATDAAAGTGASGSRLIMKLLGKIERFFYNRSEVWSTISPAMQQKLAPLRHRSQPLLFVPNWADKAFIEAVNRQQPRENRPNRPVRLLYAGNIGSKQDLLQFCKTLSDSDADFEFRIFGGGGAAQDVRKWIEECRDHRFSFGEFLDPNRLAAELMRADFYVITEKPGIQASFFPSKMVTGMTAGTPILAVCESDSPLGQEMREAEPGVRFDWESIDRVPGFLRDQNPNDWRQWHDNALRRAQYYDRQRIIGRIRGVLMRMADRGTVIPDPAEGDLPPAH